MHYIKEQTVTMWMAIIAAVMATAAAVVTGLIAGGIL